MINEQSCKIAESTVNRLQRSFGEDRENLNKVNLLIWGLINSVYKHSSEVSFAVETRDAEDISSKIYASVEFLDKDTALSAVNNLKISDDEPADFWDIDEENMKKFCPVICYGEDGSIKVSLKADEDQNSSLKVQTILKMYLNFACQIADTPQKPLIDLDRVSEEDIGKILEFYKGTKLEYDKKKTWLDLFKDRVRETPDALAISADNGTYTYKELDEASDRIALYLLDRGAKEGDFIVLLLDRVKEFVAAAAGIHKAGCAYIPVDPTYPEERVTFMIEDSGADLVLTMKDIEESLSDVRYEGKSVKDRIPGAKPSDKAYMIYTSGSTGRPKGVIIAHSSLITYSLSKSFLAGIRRSDRIIAHRTFSFDAHIEDYYPTLVSGASAFIIGEDKRRDSDEIVEFIKDNNITGGGFTTSVARVLITQYELPMRYIIAGGEALYGITGNPSIQIVNEYGPTECTDDSTWFDLETGVTYNKVPIGRPMPNLWCLILDRNSNLLPVGVAGELCVVGPQVGEGYHKRDELSAKVFTECPFIPGMKMYHTGDLARYNADGLIEYLGRIDNQIKLRGYRIELSEIENVCGRYEGIKEAVASVVEVYGSRHLVLYYTVDDEAVVDESRLRNYTDSSVLPDYMKPEFYKKLDVIPRLPNAKIDRLHMPLPDIDIEIINEQPSTALETHLLSVAKEFLPGIDFGVTDDMFVLGMTSLSAMRFTAKVNSLDLGRKYRVTDVIRYRTIRKLIAGNRRIFWDYAQYDKNKPMLVFVYGIAPVARTLQMFKAFSEKFNIFIIEATDSHYELLFKNSGFDEVNDMYMNILENRLPDECNRIDGFMGFSWGGFVAYDLAASWAEKYGDTPFVLLGDSDFAGKLSGGPVKEIKLSEYPPNLFELTGGAITQMEVVNKLNMTARLDSTVKEIKKYNGPVIMMNAMKPKTGENSEDHKKRKKKNLDVISQYASNLTVIDFPEHNHDDLFYDESKVSEYLDIMLKFCGLSNN